MPQGDKPAHSEKQKRQAGAMESGPGQKGVGRPAAQARAPGPATNKLHGGGKKIALGRKVPFGPVGGLGRKTNLARSS